MTRNEFIQRAVMQHVLQGDHSDETLKDMSSIAVKNAIIFADALEANRIPFDKHSISTILSDIENDLDAIHTHLIGA